MESRGTGVKSQRLPAAWEKGTLGMTKESPQGPAETSKPVSRGQGEIPGEVVTVLGQGAGGFVGQILAGRPGLQAERFRAGDAPVITDSNYPGSAEITGKAEIHTKGRGAV